MTDRQTTRSGSVPFLLALAALVLAVAAFQPQTRAAANASTASAADSLENYYQHNFKKLTKLVFSRMLRQMHAYPHLEDSRDIVVISALIPALERRFPGFCRFDDQQERSAFFSLPQQMLISGEEPALFAEEACGARILFLENRDFIYIALREDNAAPMRDRFGKNIIVEVIAGTGSHKDFVDRVNRQAAVLDKSGHLPPD